MPGWAISNIQTNLTAVSDDFEQKRLNTKNHFDKYHSNSLAIKGFMEKGGSPPCPQLSEFSELSLVP